MIGRRVLAFGAGSHKVGYVFLVDELPVDWKMSRKHSLSPEAARPFAERWIVKLAPDVVVVENTTKAKRKGERTKAVVEAIAEVAIAARLRVVAVPRPRHFPNKFAEAAALAERFPALKPWIPRPRKLWDAEPREVVLFEALALALEANRPKRT